MVDIKISIPKKLAENIKKKVKETDFNSVSDYVVYVLNQVVSEEKIETDEKNKHAYSDEDEAAIKKNLKDLGYM